MQCCVWDFGAAVQNKNFGVGEGWLLAALSCFLKPAGFSSSLVEYPLPGFAHVHLQPSAVELIHLWASAFGDTVVMFAASVLLPTVAARAPWGEAG